jgi:hypothetical protein
MSVRIRYGSHPKGERHLLSVRTFGDKHFRVELDTEQLVYQITSGDGSQVITGKAVSVPMLKLKAKQELERLGVAFIEEARDRSQS